MNPRARSRSLEEVMPGRGSKVRRLLALEAPPEERLARLVRERLRQFEAHVGRIEESALDLEGREQILRDSRASLERLLRLGTNDLDARESELAERIHELDAREEHIAAEESELERRRGELGAVELRRASIELRERALTAREADLIEREDRLADRGAGTPRDAGRLGLAFVPGTGYGLVELDDETGTTVGDALVLAGEGYVVARIGPSPLPGDRRRCAYLVRSAGP